VTAARILASAGLISAALSFVGGAASVSAPRVGALLISAAGLTMLIGNVVVLARRTA
jgi:hypothetical protein